MTNIKSIRFTPEDQELLDCMKQPPENESDALRRSLRFSAAFCKLREEKISKIKRCMKLYHIPPGEFINVPEIINQGISKAMFNLWRESRKCRMKELRPLFKKFRDKYRV